MDKQISLSFAIRVKGLGRGAGGWRGGRMMCVESCLSGMIGWGPFVEAPSPSGVKQTTEMPVGVCVAAVPSQMGLLRSLMQEMPLPEYVWLIKITDGHEATMGNCFLPHLQDVSAVTVLPNHI